jgi:hypothetical protein
MMREIVIFHASFAFVMLTMFAARANALNPKKGVWQAALATIILTALLTVAA